MHEFQHHQPHHQTAAHQALYQHHQAAEHHEAMQQHLQAAQGAHRQLEATHQAAHLHVSLTHPARSFGQLIGAFLDLLFDV